MPVSSLGRRQTEFARTFTPRRSLALRYAKGAAQAPRRFMRPAGHNQCQNRTQNWIELGATSEQAQKVLSINGRLVRRRGCDWSSRLN
jgi:hypothetical protein